jgi:cytochrome b561
MAIVWCAPGHGIRRCSFAFCLRGKLTDLGGCHVSPHVLAVATHYGRYAATILMAVSGIVTAAAADLPAIVFGGSSAPLPESVSNLPPRIAHGLLAPAIVALVLLRILGTLYHHLIRKDQLLRRICLGQSSTTKLANQKTNDKES